MRKKQQRFADNKVSRNVIEPGKAIFENIKGKWNDFFGIAHPNVLELACGRGEYSTGLGSIYPEKNFIGVDIKGNRIWIGSKKAKEDGLNNVAFLRTQIDHLEKFFHPGEIDEIWIIFPDPRLKGSDERRRLTHPKYLEIYEKLIRKGGYVHLKTDSADLFEYTLAVLEERSHISNLVYTRKLYDSEYAEDHHGIKTKYERQFSDQGFEIKYLKFQFS